MSNARELAELGGSYGTGGSVGMKNRIINGAMNVSQRGTSFSNINGYGLDRWQGALPASSSSTVTQSSTAPNGYANSLCVTITTGGTIGVTANYIAQYIEGNNVADLGFGTSSASTITISFWVRSSVTGIFGGSLRNYAAAPATTNRGYPFTYTINSANTWEQKIITIAGDGVSGSGQWNTGTQGSFSVFFDMGSGAYIGTANTWQTANVVGATGTQTSLMTTSGATWYITGVQLEKGSTATSFDYRPYGTELALCQRYYQVVPFVGTAVNTGEMGVAGAYKVTMRTTPSLSSVLRPALDYTGTDNQIVRYGYGPSVVGSVSFGSLSNNMYATILCTGLTTGGVYGGSTTASAEL